MPLTFLQFNRSFKSFFPDFSNGWSTAPYGNGKQEIQTMEHPYPEEDLFVQLARPNSLLPPQSVTFPSNKLIPLLLMHDSYPPLQSPSSFPFWLCPSSLSSSPFSCCDMFLSFVHQQVLFIGSTFPFSYSFSCSHPFHILS